VAAPLVHHTFFTVEAAVSIKSRPILLSPELLIMKFPAVRKSSYCLIKPLDLPIRPRR